MTDSERINRLEIQMANLQNAFLQSQKNAVPITDKVYDTANKVEQITPYTESKTAYIEDTEVIFEDVPDGNVSVYMVDSDGHNVPFTVEQTTGQIKVKFEQRESIATITIIIN